MVTEVTNYVGALFIRDPTAAYLAIKNLFYLVTLVISY